MTLKLSTRNCNTILPDGAYPVNNYLNTARIYVTKIYSTGAYFNDEVIIFTFLLISRRFELL